MGSAYSSDLSLACPLRRVEKRLLPIAAGLLVFACLCLESPSARAVTRDYSGADSGISENQEAQSFLARRKWAEAAVVLKSEVARDPRSVSAVADLAKALLYLNRREDATVALGRAIELNSGSRKTWLVEQLRLVAKAFMTNASFQIYQDGVDLLTAQRVRRSREKFDQALSAEPENVEVLTRMGQAYLMDGDYDSAAERLKLAARLDPYEPEIRLWLGRAMVLRGEKETGLAELRQGASHLDQSELAPIWLASALQSSGESRGAVEVLERDVRNNPIHVGALVELAKLKIRDPDASRDQLWSARRDFQNALSRLSEYEQPGRRGFEGELGVQIARPATDLRDEIQSELQKLESRLEVGG